MKHCVRKLALVLVLALLLSTLTLAADDTDRATVTVTDSSATLVFNDSTQSNLTLTKTGVTDGGMYLVLVLAGKEDGDTPLVPTEDNILYINQATADENGIVTFDNVYPSRIQDSTVYLSGTGLTGLTKMGFVDLKVTPGDVDGNSELEVYDALLVLQKGTGLITMTEEQELAADVNGDGSVDQYDALLILQKAVGLIENFPA